jgi:hypothetical protein
MHALGRRGLFGRSAAAVGTGLLAIQGSGEAQADTPSPAPAYQFFTAADLNFEVLFALGEVGYGAGEAGEVLAAINDINAAGASYQVFFDVFTALAQRTSAIGTDALSTKNYASARSAFLRSAQYYNQALFFVLGTSKPNLESTVYRLMQRQWDSATQLFDSPFEPVTIPYEGGFLPGYFLAANQPGRRPTVIIMNGSDAQNIDVYAFGGAAAIERGWNALIFEGPGQGSTLFLKGIPFRPDWEKVISPIVDFLCRRPDVDANRIALTGWSEGGELVIRAAAFEHRIAAVCADPGFVRTWDAFPQSIRSLFTPGATEDQVNSIWQNDVISGLSAQDRFTLAKRSEIYGLSYLQAARAGQVFTDLWTLGQTIMQFQVADVAGQVLAPTLVTQYELDQFYPTGGEELYGLLRCSKELVKFTAAEGAAYHDGPLAPQRRNQVIFDWLNATLGV